MKWTCHLLISALLLLAFITHAAWADEDADLRDFALEYQYHKALCLKSGLKNTVLDPVTNKEIECRPFSLDLFEEYKNRGADDREAFLCTTQDMEKMDQLEIFRLLKDMGKIAFNAEEVFNCPGKNQPLASVSCVQDLACNLKRKVAGLVYGAGLNPVNCPNNTDSFCFDEMIWGILKNIMGNIF